MSENGEIYTAGKNFTLPPALTAWTNSNSANTGKSSTDMIIVKNSTPPDFQVGNFTP